MNFSEEAKELNESIERINLSILDHIERGMDHTFDLMLRQVEDLTELLRIMETRLTKNVSILAAYRSEIQDLKQTIEDLTGV